MKKVVKVCIGIEVFQLEEDGYLKIQKVLKKIESGSSNGAMLIKDIERRIASILKEKTSIENLITCEMVDETINALGYAAYLKDDYTFYSPYTNYSTTGYKRLYRHPTEKVFGGVCSGIAAYVNTDPVLIRILFVVLLFGFGTGLLLYLIMWIIVPQTHSINEMH